MTARALSIQQPWAWAITDLDKRVENRSRPTSFRGEVFLHASVQSRPFADIFPLLTEIEKARLMSVDERDAVPVGAIVAVAHLVDVQSSEFGRDRARFIEHHIRQSRWVGATSYWWILDEDFVFKLAEPVPCKGALGFWKVPADVEAKVRAQLNHQGAKDDHGRALPGGAGLTTDPPPSEASEGEPAANSRKDLGYAPPEKHKRLKPDERDEVERLSRLIAEATRDIRRGLEVHKLVSKLLKEAKAQLAKLLDQLDAVESGNWPPGMFTAGVVEDE